MLIITRNRSAVEASSRLECMYMHIILRTALGDCLWALNQTDGEQIENKFFSSHGCVPPFLSLLTKKQLRKRNKYYDGSEKLYLNI